MIVDTSALLAILYEEPEHNAVFAALNNALVRRMSVASYLEVHLRIIRADNADSRHLFDQIFAKLNITLEPVTETQIKIAIDAFDCFGKGRGHPAQLNYGDCFTYALATEATEPLLFIGNDFSQTDLTWIDLETGLVTQKSTR